MGELGEEFGLEFGGVGEVIGVRDVADGFEGFEDRGRGDFIGGLAVGNRRHVREKPLGKRAEFELVEEGFQGLVVAL